MQSTGENLDIHITGPLLSGIETLPSTSETDTTPYELKNMPGWRCICTLPIAFLHRTKDKEIAYANHCRKSQGPL